MRPTGDDSAGARHLRSEAMSDNDDVPSVAPAPEETPARGLGLRTDAVADLVAGITEAAVGPVRPPPRWLRWPLVWWHRLIALVVLFGAGFGLFVATLEQFETLGLASFPAALLGAAQTLALVAVSVSPLLGWRWLCLALLVGQVLVPPGDWPWPVTSMVLLALVVYLVASTHTQRVGIGVWVLTTAVVLVPATVVGRVPVPVVVVLSAVAAVVVLLGDTVRDRRVVRSRLESAAVQRRQDLARQAVLEERSHIARELHDVVAHHMSMIAVQAEAAPLRYPDLSPEVAQTFVVIRDASREALGEMRRVVGVLRNDDEAADRTPVPGTDQLASLVEGSRRAGMSVVLDVSGKVRPLPPAVDVSVYRVVQEALSNARRHAPGAKVSVQIAYLPDRLAVRVVDDGLVPASAGDAATDRRDGGWYDDDE